MKRAKELTNEERKEFVEKFYEAAEGLNDMETPCPWGCVWTYQPNHLIDERNLAKAALEFWNSHKEHILTLIEEEKLS